MSLLALISSLISVLNPIGAVPMFISFTSNRTPEEIKKISIKCTFYVFLILVVAFVSGNLIMDFFSISINSMKVAGGIIMLLSGVSFINNKRDTHKGINQKVKIEAIEKEDISFTPLAMPLLAGPGSMSYLVSLNFADQNLSSMLIVFLAIFLVCAFILVVLLSSRYFAKLIGTSGLMALSRLMGFFVMCIGVELIYTGVKNFVLQS
ncbi:MAG: MarC family protein [Bacteroidetes bacterium]|jgi:multiple antibiotic resistance protein|nr:MarC family protein [Bacteroidota bacterium]